MFRGTFEHTIDDKGRVAIPMRYRDVLQSLGDDRLMITNFFIGDVRCLDIYPHAQWTKLEELLGTKPQFDKKMLWFNNYYVSPAQEGSLDKQGRILLHPGLRDYAGLVRDVVFSSAFTKFRLWSREAWQQMHGESERGLREHPELMEALGI